MNRYEMDEALERIEILAVRRSRLLAQAKETDHPGYAELCYQWADAAADEAGRIKNELWAAQYHIALEARARGELPL
jgi:hypothetical protein